MRRQARFGAAAAGFAALLLGGCGGGSFGANPSPSQPVAMQPITTAEGIQQFSVPSDGRILLSQRLRQEIVAEPILEARISNAWRTAASASRTPNDYAACVSATTSGGTRTFMIVKSGGGTGDVIRGAQADQRCSDSTRVVQWVPFSEAVATR